MKYSLYTSFFIGELCMWKEEINGIGQRFAEAYSIPKDVIANATLLHVVGMSEIFLENFKGIISNENISVSKFLRSNSITLIYFL